MSEDRHLFAVEHEGEVYHVVAENLSEARGAYIDYWEEDASEISAKDIVVKAVPDDEEIEVQDESDTGEFSSTTQTAKAWAESAYTCPLIIASTAWAD